MAAKKKKNKKAKARTKKKKTSPEQVETYMFCRHDKVRYVPTATRWPAFRDGKNSMLRFHAAGLPPEALSTEIELFAARLDKYLLAVGFAAKEGARYATRGAVSGPTDPLQLLLTAVDHNYREIES